jgi:hypothetical protein
MTTKTSIKAATQDKSAQKLVKPRASKTSHEVDLALHAASSAASDMKTLAMKAAELAAAELPAGKNLTAKEKVNAVIKAHAVTLAEVDQNVRAIFSATLTLLAAPNQQVEFMKGKNEAAPVYMKASEAVKAGIAKHALIAAAKEVREAEGTANKGGAGTKPKTDAQKVDAMKPSFIAALPAIVADVKALSELRAELKKLGFNLTASKAVGARKPAPASIAGMTKQISEMAPATI